MDFIVPLPKSKNNKDGILNVVSSLSKMIRLIPITANVDAIEVAKLFKDNVYRHHGLPQKIISDRYSIFMSKFCKTWFRSLGTNIAPSTAFHSQTDGQNEIANRKVEEMIRAFANFRKDIWDEHVVDFEVAYNSAIHSTTLYSPFFLNYGISPRTVPVLPSCGEQSRRTRQTTSSLELVCLVVRLCSPHVFYLNLLQYVLHCRPVRDRFVFETKILYRGLFPKPQSKRQEKLA